MDMSGSKLLIIMVVSIFIGLIGSFYYSKYLRSLVPLKQCWTQYYILAFVSICTILSLWWKLRKQKEKSGCGCQNN